MEEKLISIVAEHQYVAILLSVIFLIGSAIKILKGALDFHYEYFTRKHLRRVAEILPLVESSKALYDFTQAVIDTEAFKIASGVKASKPKALALIFLCKHNRLPIEYVKSMARYIEPNDDGTISVNISGTDKTLAILSLIISTVTFIYGLVILAALSWTGREGLIVGSILFLAFSIATRLFSYDIRRYRYAKQLQKSLDECPLPVYEALVSNPN